MSSLDLIKMAFRNLFKRKVRTLLTVVSFVIGCLCIVLVVSLGIGMNENFKAMIDQMGNVLVVNVQSRAFYMDSAPQDTPIIDDNAIVSFANLDGADVATPVMRGNFSIISGKYMSWGNIMGIDMTLFEKLGYSLGEGRLPNKDDEYGVVMGHMVLSNFWDPTSRNPWGSSPPEFDPFEDKFEFNLLSSWDERGRPLGKPVKFDITGLTPEGGMNDYEVYMDIEDVKALEKERQKQEKQNNNQSGGGGGMAVSVGRSMSGNGQGQKNKGYETALVKCSDLKTVVKVQDAIKEMGFDAWSNGEWISNMQNMTQSLQSVLGVLGGVSLFVAAIGIANTMFTSVYERTREIGIMKVIGATLADVRRLFLIEAGIIGMLGGILGLGLSFLGSYILNNAERLSFLDAISWNPEGATGPMSIIPVWLCVLALAFSAAIGVIAGYLPAIRATKLSALAAIRTD